MTKTPIFTAPSLQNFSPQRIYHEVANQLRRAISDGELKPGDKLPPERELAQMCGVSRNTMREALRILGQSGLIEHRLGSKGGAFVRLGSPNAVVNGMRDLYFLGAITPEDLIEARVAICASAIRMVAGRIGEAELKELEDNVDAAEEAHKRGDVLERTRRMQAFHVLLAKATHNPIMIATAEGVAEVTRQFVNALGPASMHRSTLAARRQMIALLRENRTEEAVSVMSASLQKLHDRYMTLAKGSPPGEPVGRKARKSTARTAAGPEEASRSDALRKRFTNAT